MDIAEFLAARYDEERQRAEEASRPGMGAKWRPAGAGADGRFVVDAAEGFGSWAVARFSFAAQGEHAILHDPARVLADLAAKQRLVNPDTWAGGPETEDVYQEMLRILATRYVEHPDYDPAWNVDAAY